MKAYQITTYTVYNIHPARLPVTDLATIIGMHASALSHTVLSRRPSPRLENALRIVRLQLG